MRHLELPAVNDERKQLLTRLFGGMGEERELEPHPKIQAANAAQHLQTKPYTLHPYTRLLESPALLPLFEPLSS